MNSVKLLSVLILLVVLSCNEDKRQTPNDYIKENWDAYSSKDSVRAGNLFSARAIKELLDSDKDCIIFEVSSKDEYDRGHIPGAYHLRREDFSSPSDTIIEGMRASREAMEKLLSDYGVQPNSKILIYDARANVEALRLIWILQMYGHDNLYLINGSKKAWSEAAFELVSDMPLRPSPSHYKFDSIPNKNITASLSDVEAAVGDTNVVILDTREAYEYFGYPHLSDGHISDYKKGAFAAGRIPGAVQLNWSSSVDLKSDHRFKSLHDLEYNFKQVGVTKDKKIIVYCHSGTRSAHTYYVLKEILHYPDVRNYDGSWIEWSYRHVQDNLPIETTELSIRERMKDSLLHIQNKLNE